MNILTPNRAKLPQPVSNALDKILSAIGGVWNIEHHDDGTHGDITVDSIAVDSDPGDGSFTGSVSGSLVPTSATQDLGATITRTSTLSADHPWRHLRLSGTISWVPFSESGISGGTTLTQNGAGALTWTFSTTGTLLTITGSSGSVTFTSSGVLSAPSMSANPVITGSLGFFERSRSTALGEWTTFTPTRTASAGTWTAGTILTAAWAIEGKQITVAFYIISTSVSNANVVLKIAIPGGFVAAKYTGNPITQKNAGAAYAMGNAEVVAAGTTIDFYINYTGTFGIAVTNTDIIGEITFEVQ